MNLNTFYSYNRVRYKVGDMVRVRDKEKVIWLSDKTLKNLKRRITEVTGIKGQFCRLKIDDGTFNWPINMLEHVYVYKR